MKFRHGAPAIMTGLVALSIIATVFVATAVAVGTIHYPYAFVDRKGKNFTFNIDTSTDTTYGAFSGLDVDPNSIVITITDMKSNTITIDPDLTSITLAATTITIQLVKQDVPNRASAYNIVGNIVNGYYVGDTFFASGPGWAWSNVH